MSTKDDQRRSDGRCSGFASGSKWSPSGRCQWGRRRRLLRRTDLVSSAIPGTQPSTGLRGNDYTAFPPYPAIRSTTGFDPTLRKINVWIACSTQVDPGQFWPFERVSRCCLPVSGILPPAGPVWSVWTLCLINILCRFSFDSGGNRWRTSYLKPSHRAIAPLTHCWATAELMAALVCTASRTMSHRRTCAEATHRPLPRRLWTTSTTRVGSRNLSTKNCLPVGWIFEELY